MKRINQCQKSLPVLMATTTMVIGAVMSSAAIGYYAVGSIAACEIMIWGMFVNTAIAWLAINGAARRRSEARGIYFNRENGVLTLLTECCGNSKTPKIYINIPSDSDKFEIFEAGPTVGAESKYLKQSPSPVVDKIFFTLLPSSGIHQYKTEMGCYIVFDAGLDLSSPFGSLSSIVVGIPESMHIDMVEEANSNSQFAKSKFGQTLLKVNTDSNK